MLARVLAIGMALVLSGCAVSSGALQAQAGEMSQTDAKSYISVPEVQTFIDYMVTAHQYDRDLLVKMFSKTQKREQVITKSNNQPEAITPYFEYRRRFLGTARVRQGVNFAKRNRVWLDKAEKEFGVPWPIIVSLLGVETAYGNITGNRDVFTSLTTLAFDYPRRGKYFRSELESYLLLARSQGWTVGETNGSYTGALGMVQFMPSNYLKLAIDYDQNGHVDLWKSEADAIGSIANYLKHHGWQTSEPVAVTARVEQRDRVKVLINKGHKPLHSLREWGDMGVWSTSVYAPGKAGLIALQDREDVPAYWLAYENFFTLMDYNPSRRYAMSVLELANRIAQREGS